ncbi:hypothetical protein JD844_014721, partial [Phrynosoma platyrhinos]
EDEDGDRITVRSDEEMKAMLSYVEKNNLKKSSAELKKILANGQMNEQDIRYRDILGHGNGGTVYKANHVPSGKILAVKVIPLDITLELQKQIMSELEILYKCDSSYIIGFYGAFFVENRISLCTEFMDGGSLDVYRKIPEHVLGRIAVAVVKGLTYLWSLKILHRAGEFHSQDVCWHERVHGGLPVCIAKEGFSCLFLASRGWELALQHHLPADHCLRCDGVREMFLTPQPSLHQAP